MTFGHVLFLTEKHVWSGPFSSLERAKRIRSCSGDEKGTGPRHSSGERTYNFSCPKIAEAASEEIPFRGQHLRKRARTVYIRNLSHLSTSQKSVPCHRSYSQPPELRPSTHFLPVICDRTVECSPCLLPCARSCTHSGRWCIRPALDYTNT